MTCPSTMPPPRTAVAHSAGMRRPATRKAIHNAITTSAVATSSIRCSRKALGLRQSWIEPACGNPQRQLGKNQHEREHGRARDRDGWIALRSLVSTRRHAKRKEQQPSKAGIGEEVLDQW